MVSDHFGPPAEELFWSEGIMIRGCRLDRAETWKRFGEIVYLSGQFPRLWNSRVISPWDQRMSVYLEGRMRDHAGYHLDHWKEDA